MNFLFTQKNVYHLGRTIDDVIEDFAAITQRKWYDFSENITGRLNPDNTFRISNKWSFAYVSGVTNYSLICLNGSLKRDGNSTIIETTSRPNIVILLFLYLIAILFLLELFGMTTMIEGPKIYTLLFLPFFWVILFGITTFEAKNLQKRFERMLRINNQ
jgi:hypothetical protein